MSFLFGGLIMAMLITAIGLVAIPFRSGKPPFGPPGILVSIAIPAIALGMYAYLGSPNAVTAESGQLQRARFDSNSASKGGSGKAAASVASLVERLKERLEQEPDDGGGWLLLARSYEHLGRHPEAMLAFKRARSLGKTDFNLDNLLPATGVSVQEAAANSDPALRGRVALSPEAALRVSPDDTIFIFAKESPDHRMPVVALRKRASDLPIEFVLTDAQAMVPGTHLADFETLVVTARVSRSGLATDALEQLEVWSDPVSPVDGGEIQLLIGTVLQYGDRDDE